MEIKELFHKEMIRQIQLGNILQDNLTLHKY